MGMTPANEVQGIYVVKSQPGLPVKVGVTADLSLRVMGLQTGNWNELKAHWFSFVAPARQRVERNFFNSLTNSAMKLERLVHQQMAQLDLAVGGEWFDCDPDAAVLVIQKVAKMNDLEFFDIGVMKNLTYGSLVERSYVRLAERLIAADQSAKAALGLPVLT